MKYLLLSLLIISSALGEDENCDDPTAESISMLTSLQVPNCLQQRTILQQTQISSLAETRRESNLPVPNTPGPICGDCLNSFQVRVPDALTTQEKKDAFFQTAYNELEKSLSSIAFDITGFGSTWNMGTNFSSSLNACKSDNIEKALKACSSPFLSQFKSKNLTNRVAGEIASLIATNRTGIKGILERPDNVKTCPIPDIAASNLRQYLFEETITPEIIRQINSVEVTSPAVFQSRLSSTLGAQTYRLLLDHPVLKNLIQNPSLFKNTFSQISMSGTSETIKSSFRNVIHSPDIGSAMDTANAEKCTTTINTFTSALCSDNFKDGNIALGPFHNYKKYMNDQEVPAFESDASTNDIQIKSNIIALQFCEAPSNSKLSLGEILSSINKGMPQGDRQKSLQQYAREAYRGAYGGLKDAMCAFHPNPSCPDNAGDACKLYRIYMSKQTTPEGRIATSSDDNVKRVLQNLIGTGGPIDQRTREVLVAEGILPQSNGTFVEKESVREREPGYLAGVANGTITPNVGPSQPGTTRTQRQQAAAQPQQSIFQPIAQGQQATASQVQPDTSDDDTEGDLRRFNRELEERLARAKAGSQTALQPSAAQTRRSSARSEIGERSSQPGTARLAQLPQTTTAASVGALPSPTPVNNTEASLDRDTTAQTRAEQNRNAALAQMSGARANPFASGDASRSPASATEGQGNSDQTVALTVSGDIRANLERVLNGTDSSGESLRNKIKSQSPFRFQLNNSIFDVQFTNGTCVVTSRSSDTRNAELARTLQGLFNNSLRSSANRSTAGRSETLENLRQNLR